MAQSGGDDGERLSSHVRGQVAPGLFYCCAALAWAERQQGSTFGYQESRSGPPPGGRSTGYISTATCGLVTRIALLKHGG
jgi:hypothetical protein